MSASQDAAPSPPIAERRRVVHNTHGDERIDDYAWLRDKPDPAVAAYLEAENAYADAILAPTAELQESLYAEMLARIKETDDTPPYREGNYWWYSRTEEGKQYPILCRKAGSLDAPEQVTLDVNALAEGQPFMSLGAYTASNDGRMLAYSTDNTGFRQYTLHVKDLDTGEVLPDRVERTGAVAWAADGRTLFYTVEDEAKRQHRLYRHRLGDEQDELVYEEPDERFNVSVGRSRSREFLFMSIDSHTTSEVRVLAADTPEGAWRIVATREQDHEYDIDHQGGWFYIRTNDHGRNFRLVRAPVDDPSRANWQEVLPHRDGVMLDSLLAFENHLALWERERGLQQVAVQRAGSDAWQRIAFDEPVFTVYPQANREYRSNRLRFSYESLVIPDSIYDYDMDTGERTLLKRVEVLGGYDPAQYESERIFVAARDGEQVPVSLLRRRGTPQDGSAPMYLTGYGSYGLSWDVDFSSNRVSLLDRGFTFAVAHIRGGGEMGKRWHDAGRMAHKMNTFTDFIDVADALVAREDTSADRLVVEGGSAGGLLMGAITNMRPDLFHAVISRVPFVDVLNTMLDASLPLTVAEYEEWGNPNIADEYAVMRAYCPYTNLEAKDYPAILVKTSFNDSQVMYWEPAKYVAKLRTLKTDANPLLLKTNMEAGHGGASGRYDYLREVAYMYAFTLWITGKTR